jgi:hypothetical protein
VTAEANAHVRFRRSIERRALWAAEDAARELPNLPLEDALKLVHLYAERESPKFERAALRWLERCLVEASPNLQDFADITARLAKLDGALLPTEADCRPRSHVKRETFSVARCLSSTER